VIEGVHGVGLDKVIAVVERSEGKRDVAVPAGGGGVRTGDTVLVIRTQYWSII
jgi:hypothetical protein